MNKTKWFFLTPGANRDFSLLTEAGYSRLVAMALNNRAIATPDSAKKFFYPHQSHLEDPWLLPDIKDGINRVATAVKEKEKIIVYGDYDVDGTTGTTLLYSALKKIGAHVDYYLPHRLKEGYGLNLGVIDTFYSSGIKLIITVDCGTSNIKEVEKAKGLGIDVIVTDHHEPDNVNLPSACALINPKVKHSRYPYPYLAGVGVVFKFIQALSEHFPQINYEDYLGLTALGTIADIVPMTGENRVISHLGLALMNSNSISGLKALMEISKIQVLDTSGVLFKIAPRINALGRLDYASLAVQLLASTDIEEARSLSFIAEERNNERKDIQDRIMMEALEQIEHNGFRTEKSPVFLKASDWHIGVLGIVASKLVEKYYRPVYLIMSNNHEAKGSARGIDGFSIYNSLYFCQDLLVKFGGHALAGGFSLNTDKIDLLKKKLDSYVEKNVEESILSPSINVEGEAHFSEIDLHVAEQFKSMEPFGTDNPCPIFCSYGVKVLNSKFMGRDEEHVKLMLQQGEITQEAVGFKMGKSYSHLIKPSSVVDLVYSIDINYWRHEPILRLTLKDLRPSIQNPVNISTLKTDFEDISSPVVSSHEQIITESFMNDQKIMASFSDMGSLIKLLHHLIYITFSKKMKKLVLIHPLRMDANRHYRYLKMFFANKGIKVFLLNGSINGVEKERVLESLKADFPCLIITTMDYLCCYKKFFLPQWNNMELVAIDDHLIDYSSNLLIQLEDLADKKGFLFLTLKSKLKFTNCLKYNFHGNKSPEIYSSVFFPEDIEKKFSGKTISYFLTEDRLKEGIAKISDISKYGILLGESSYQERKNIIEKFKSGNIKYIISSSSFVYELYNCESDNIVLFDCLFTWNEFALISSFCKNLYLSFSKEDITYSCELINSRLPDREILINYYNFLRSTPGNNLMNLLASKNLPRDINPDMLKICISIFEEIGLYRVCHQRNGYSINLVDNKEKLDLFSSPCYLECLKQREHFAKLSSLFTAIDGVKNKMHILKGEV